MKPGVALVAHGVHDRGGMERACAQLIRYAHNDYDFTVISAELAPDLEPLVRHWIRIRVPMRPIPLKFALFWVRARRLLTSVDVDLVHTIGAIIPGKVDVASIHFCHAGFRNAVGRVAPPSQPIFRRVNSSLAYVLAVTAERWCYRPSHLRAFAAVSPGVRTELRTFYPAVEAHLTPNGVDFVRFAPNKAVREEMRSAAALENEPIALFVGGDWDRKGLVIALDALALIRNEGIDIRLWVVGEGDQSRFAALAGKLGIQAAVTFFGLRHDTERFFAAADIFVLPSLYEAAPLVGFEAAASGLPIVATSANGIGDLAQEGAGIVARRSPETFADALRTLVDDENLRHRLGQTALQLSRGYSWRASAAAVTNLYESLLSSRA